MSKFGSKPENMFGLTSTAAYVVGKGSQWNYFPLEVGDPAFDYILNNHLASIAGSSMGAYLLAQIVRLDPDATRMGSAILASAGVAWYIWAKETIEDPFKPHHDGSIDFVDLYGGFAAIATYLAIALIINPQPKKQQPK